MKKKVAKKAVQASDVEIAALAEGAARTHDDYLTKLCSRALLGNAKARTECARIVTAIKAQQAVRETESFLNAHLPPKLLRKG